MPQNNQNKPSSSFGWTGAVVMVAAVVGGLFGYIYGSQSERPEGQRQMYRKQTSGVPIVPPALCSICREDICPQMEQLPCGHMYHQKCILQWLQVTKKEKCPDCRYELSDMQVREYVSRAQT